MNAGETAKVAVEDNYYYSNLDKIAKASRKDVEEIYNIQKSYFEGNCITHNRVECNGVIKNMFNFTQNSIVKSRYPDLRKQTLEVLHNNPELVETYFNNEVQKFKRRDRSILNRYLLPALEMGGGVAGGVGAVGGTVVACAETAGFGCYFAAVMGSAGFTTSSGHVSQGYSNFGKPLSEQDATAFVRQLKAAGLSDDMAKNVQFTLDVFGTGGAGYAVGTRAAAAGQKALGRVPATSPNRIPFIPERPLRVAPAHSINTIGPRTYFGGGNRNTTKTIAKGNVDLNADVKALNAGEGIVVDASQRLIKVPSGRIWSYHDGNAAGAYPVKGDGLVSVTQAEFTILQQMTKSNGLTGNARKAFDGMRKANNSGLSDTSERKLIELYNTRNR